jgi:pheromone a factor receptor
MDTTTNLNYRSMQAILAPALSLLALILCLPPMVWHVSNRNWGASFLVGFVIYSDAINILNALIWPTDNIDSWWNGYGYCDLQAKLSIATQVGMPGALLCIFRSLAMVMDVDNAALVPSRAQRLRNKAIDVFFCIGLPVLAMVAHVFVQGSRYYIFAISGCNASFDGSWPDIALSFAWAPVICLGAAWYCGKLIIITTLNIY